MKRNLKSGVATTSLVSRLNSQYLNGLSSNNFLNVKRFTVSTYGLDQNTWYPVVFQCLFGSVTTLDISSRHYTEEGVTWNTHQSNEFMYVVKADIKTDIAGWCTPASVNVLMWAVTQWWGWNTAIRGLTCMENNPYAYFFLRGGAKIAMTLRSVNELYGPKVYTEKFAVDSNGSTTLESVEPTTVMPPAISDTYAKVTQINSCNNSISNINNSIKSIEERLTQLENK